jgi:hypothetical protein
MCLAELQRASGRPLAEINHWQIARKKRNGNRHRAKQSGGKVDVGQ